MDNSELRTIEKVKYGLKLNPLEKAVQEVLFDLRGKVTLVDIEKIEEKGLPYDVVPFLVKWEESGTSREVQIYLYTVGNRQDQIDSAVYDLRKKLEGT